VRFFHVTDRHQVSVSRSLREACEAREIPYAECIPGRWKGEGARPGDAMYRSSPLAAAARLEISLYTEGVATFWTDPKRLLHGMYSQWLALRAAGVPIIDGEPVTTASPADLSATVERLGGFPVVAKVPGGTNGIGVMRIDTPATLHGLIAWLARKGRWPILMRYFPLVAAHRLTVIGPDVVAPYSKRPSGDDFRTNVAESVDLGPFEPRQAIIDLALQTARALGQEFGGVDILEDADRNLVVTESNNPCFFTRQEEVTGYDVAGHMLEYLAGKARRLVA